MSTWSHLRRSVGLPAGKAPSAVLVTVMILLVAGWLLQERVSAPDPSELDYSEVCKLIADGKVDMVVITGQAIEGNFAAAQTIANHRTQSFRTTAPASDPTFLPLLHDKNVRVRVIRPRLNLMTRLLLGALPLSSFLGLGLWFSRRESNASPR
ncbi:MAG: hypothetical protein ABI488_22220 [Polyangiaceae bacterium]